MMPGFRNIFISNMSREGNFPFMSIANELCSEVVNAVLMHQEVKGQVDLKETTRILLEVHQTLRRLHADERRRFVAPFKVKEQSLTNVRSSSQSH